MPVWDTEFPIIVFSEEAAEEEFQSLEPVEEIPGWRMMSGNLK